MKAIDIIAGTVAALLVLAGTAAAQPAPCRPSPPTAATQAANAAVLKALPFSDREDFANATRGFIAGPTRVTIKARRAMSSGPRDLQGLHWRRQAAPDTVNPSLWRNAQLNMHHGCTRCPTNLPGARYDLSNITFIQGKAGWIVFDPLISTETAKAAYDLVTKHLGKKPVLAWSTATRTSTTTAACADRGREGRQGGEGEDHRARAFPRARGQRKRDRGQRHEPSRHLHVRAMLPRTPMGGVNGGLGQTTSRYGNADQADPLHHQDGAGDHDRRREDGVPAHAGHRGACRDEHVLPSSRHVDGGELHGHDAQHPHAARRAGTRCAQVASFLNETIELYERASSRSSRATTGRCG